MWLFIQWKVPRCPPRSFLLCLFPFNPPLIFPSVLILHILSFPFLFILISSPLFSFVFPVLSSLSFPYPSSPFNSYFLISLSLIFSTLYFFPFPISPLPFFLFPFLSFSFISTHLLSSSLPYSPLSSLLFSIFLPITPEPPVLPPLLSSCSVLWPKL